MTIKQTQWILLNVAFLLLVTRCTIAADSKPSTEDEDESIVTKADDNETDHDAEVEKTLDADVEKDHDADPKSELDKDQKTILDEDNKTSLDAESLDAESLDAEILDADAGASLDADTGTIIDAGAETIIDAGTETTLDAPDSSDQTDHDTEDSEHIWNEDGHIWGITIDDPTSQMDDIVDAIGSFEQRMMTRVVCSTSLPVTECASYITPIAAVSDILGQIADSNEVPELSVSEYLSRTTEYLDQLGNVVALWEVGNEINGEWLGNASDVIDKIHGAYQIVKARGKKAAITLYYNGSYENGIPSENNCWLNAEEHMMTWSRKNIPNNIRQGLDYIFVSYYEEDCENIQPDWPTIFEELADFFPNAKFGIGECTAYAASLKEAFINRYYRDLKIDDSRFVGGYFWWLGVEDFVPKTQPYWQFLQNAMNAREAAEGY